MKKYFYFFICFLYIFIFVYNSYSQVCIKERVEIEPKGSNPLDDVNINYIRGYTLCGPYMVNSEEDHYWQVVWAGYWGPIDPA